LIYDKSIEGVFKGIQNNEVDHQDFRDWVNDLKAQEFESGYEEGVQAGGDYNVGYNDGYEAGGDEV